MNFDNFNKVIKYIENNLDNQIDLKKVSQITGMNDFIFQRIFIFLTGMTLNEYIKKRRLSKAFEEIKNTKQKILDIAIKYQYNSASSFNRAFKQLFGITPSSCRNSNNSYKLIPVFIFEDILKNNKYNFSYDIKIIDDIELYCYHTVSDDYSNLLYKIRNLYSRIKKHKNYKIFNEVGMYGIFSKNDNKYHYYVGSINKDSKLEKYTIKKGKYAIFKIKSREQKNIIDLENKIYKQWFSSTSYITGDNDNFELYDNENCYIYVSIK